MYYSDSGSGADRKERPPNKGRPEIRAGECKLQGSCVLAAGTIDQLLQADSYRGRFTYSAAGCALRAQAEVSRD